MRFADWHRELTGCAYCHGGVVKLRNDREILSAMTKYINNNFGSKRGTIATLKYKLLYLLGFYRSLKYIDFSKVNRLVFICSGNICRSSFGEYIAKAKGINAESYGLHCRGGDKADPRAVHEAKIRGIDMESHITRNISDYKRQQGDLFLVMEPQHLLELKAAAVEYPQVTLVPLWSESPIPYLHDPFSSNNFFFSRCESVIEECVNKIHARLDMEESLLQKKAH
ncbi:hypothetical protein KA005_74350 [bacterium]|nr:hypothetical protein [bacterium]